jgi:glycosyltransferase involved in cell wall biosynthesis
MHIAYIHQHFSTTGGATGTRSYAMSRRLIEAGHDVTMICGQYAVGDRLTESQGRVTETDIDGIRVLRVAEPYSNEMGFARRLLAFGSFARAAGSLITGLDADLVFATSTPLTVGIPGVKGARRLGVPFVFEVRDLWPELAIELGILRDALLVWSARRLERRIYRAADRIIALAPGIKEGICRTGIPRERVAMIPNCADLDLFRPSEQRLNDSRFGDPDDMRLVFTGAHGMANGLDSVLDVAEVLKQWGERGVRFVFVGSGGQKKLLMERCREEGLDELVSWVDPIPKHQLAQILPCMDVGMMILRNVPAFYYGTSPNKFFDYLACGLPVLNNYPGWLAGLIEQHQCGVVVPPDDPEAFAKAVLAFRDDPKGRREMGARGRALAEQEFSLDKLAPEFIRVLEEAAGKKWAGTQLRMANATGA